MHLPEQPAGYVMVVGDIMLDVYSRATVDRISQEAPVPVAKLTGEIQYKPGGAANVAANIRAMGSKVILVGACGFDALGVMLGQVLVQAGVDAALMQGEDLQTTTKTRIMAGRDFQSQLMRLDMEGTPGEALVSAIRDGACASLQDKKDPPKCLVISDYGKGAVSDPQPLIRAARAAGIPVLVDPKSEDWSKYSGATIIKPNEAEFLAAMGVRSMQAIEYRNVRQALKAMHIGAAVVTLGSAGAIIVDANLETTIKVPAAGHPGAVVDVAGAGDTVLAAMAAWMGTGLDHPSLVAIGMRAAAIAVSRVGTSIVTRKELADA